MGGGDLRIPEMQNVVRKHTMIMCQVTVLHRLCSVLREEYRAKAGASGKTDPGSLGLSSACTVMCILLLALDCL